MQQNNTAYEPLTDARIRQVLAWWLQTQPANAGKSIANHSTEDDTILLNTYYRLMEIYCMVKAGGVKGQIEAAQTLLAREKVALEAEIAAVNHSDSLPNQISLLQQEILELGALHRLANLPAESDSDGRGKGCWQLSSRD